MHEQQQHMVHLLDEYTQLTMERLSLSFKPQLIVQRKTANAAVRRLLDRVAVNVHIRAPIPFVLVE